MDITELSGYADFEWAVKLNRFSLIFVGLWPQETSSSKETLYSNLRLFSTFVSLNLVFAIPSLYSLVMIWDDMTAVIHNMLYSLPLTTLCVKLLILWWKRGTLSPLMTMVAHDWIKLKSNEERNIMIRCAQNARLIITCNYCLAITAAIFMIITSGLGYTMGYVTNITDTGKPLPMQINYMYDTSVSPQFELTFLVQCFTMVPVGLSYIGINNFIGLLVFHICGQLENLTGRLYRMREFEDFMTALRINVADHIRLTRSIAIIENTFTLMLLLLFLYFGILFCVYGFLIVTVILEEKNVSVKKATFLILVVCTAFANMCVYCVVGELLMIKYEGVYNAVYEINWYTLETKEAKNLILLMLCTSQPLYITAGKLLPMTMSTFCSILKTSGGYISILLANRK